MRSREPSNNLLEFARTANAGAPKQRRPSAAPPKPGPSVPPSAPSATSAPGYAEEHVANLRMAPPPSVAPAYGSVAAQAAPMRSPETVLAPASRAGTVFIAVAGVVGLVVTLYRNDVLFGLAGASPAYHHVEQALGSPGFGTPRSVDALVHAVPAKAAAAAGPERKASAEPARDAPTPAAPPHAEEEAPSVDRETSAAGATTKGAARTAAPKRAWVAPKHAAAADKAEKAEKPEPKAAKDDSAPAEPKPSKKEKAEPKADTTPALSLDDAIKQSMEKKKH